MSVLSARVAALSVVLAAFGMTACSTSTAHNVRPELDAYWSAAKETYAAGDYLKTADHLERLIGDDNQYTARAIPWYLALTSGMAAGHKEVADYYAAQARLHKSAAAAFHAKASAHRTMA